MERPERRTTMTAITSPCWALMSILETMREVRVLTRDLTSGEERVRSLSLLRREE